MKRLPRVWRSRRQSPDEPVLTGESDAARRREEFERRRSAILQHAEAARIAILSRHDSLESARVELDDLEEYTRGRLGAAFDHVYEMRFYRGEARLVATSYDDLDVKVRNRRAVIDAHYRRARKAIWARHSSHESAKAELAAAAEYRVGRLDVVAEWFDEEVQRRFGTQ